MVVPTAEKLASMGLLKKKESISTEVLFLRHDAKRKDYLDRLQAENADMEGIDGMWGCDSSPTANGLRCNANCVLVSVGARIPELGARQATRTYGS